MGHELSVDPDGTRRYLLLRAASSMYAIPLDRIVRVLRSGQTYPVPGSREAFLGLIQYKGEPVIALELRALIEHGQALTSEAAFAIIVWAGPPDGKERIALAVDDALTIVSILKSKISTVDDNLIKGETIIDGDVIRILDLTRIGSMS